MSDIGPDLGPDAIEPEPVPVSEHVPEPVPEPELRMPRAGSRADRSGRGRTRGCIPMLLVLVLVVGGAVLGGSWALDKVRSLVGDNPDYPGPGTGSVTVQVHESDTSTVIARTLKEAGVVKSVGAFVDAATAEPRSRGIQVGYYRLKKQMKASAALALLIDPQNLIQTRVVVREGARVKDVVTEILGKTAFTRKQVNAALGDTAALGLPPEAGGEVEGYLFPATYDVVPDETPMQLLQQMVAKTKQVEQDLGITAKAARLGFTPKQILTVASILEYEGSRGQDYPKIARAIYNRLDQGMRLQSDATVAYANNLSGTVFTTDAERNNPSPYNTYAHDGLPPGPIGSPGEQTIKAALNPVAGPWLYWLVVNLQTGETRFNETYAGHLRDKEVLLAYCRSVADTKNKC